MWKVTFSKKAEKQLDRLSPDIRKRIVQAVEQKLAVDPNIFLFPLAGGFSEFYKFRVGQ
jgi:mRNA-degrading endonuclease RelE of RelBE toxin-antitoxin system